MNIHLNNALSYIYRLWWSQFKLEINKLFRNTDITKRHYMALNFQVYELVENYDVQAERLYEDIEKYFFDYTTATVRGALIYTGQEFLRHYEERWSTINTAADILQGICSPLNTWTKEQYVSERRNVYRIHQLALVVWRKVGFFRLKGKLTEEILLLIHHERYSGPVDGVLIREVLCSYIMLGLRDTGFLQMENTLTVYRAEFEDEYLRVSDEFYENKKTTLQKLLSQNDYDAELARIETHDQISAQFYLHPTTLHKLIHMLDRPKNEE